MPVQPTYEPAPISYVTVNNDGLTQRWKLQFTLTNHKVYPLKISNAIEPSNVISEAIWLTPASMRNLGKHLIAMADLHKERYET